MDTEKKQFVEFLETSALIGLSEFIEHFTMRALHNELMVYQVSSSFSQVDLS